MYVLYPNRSRKFEISTTLENDNDDDNNTRYLKKEDANLFKPIWRVEQVVSEDTQQLEDACDLWWHLWNCGIYRRPPYINMIGWRTATTLVQAMKSPKPFQVALGPLYQNLDDHMPFGTGTDYTDDEQFCDQDAGVNESVGVNNEEREGEIEGDNRVDENEGGNDELAPPEM